MNAKKRFERGFWDMIYKCVNCGANAIFSPEHGTMFCESCDSINSEKKMPGGGMVSCVNCGAEIEPKQYQSAYKCEYCDTYMIFDERVEGEYEPHLIMPFKISKKQAIENIKKEFGKKLFLPSGFLKEASLKTMEGIYVPFFMYDFFCQYDYEGTGKKVRVWRVGNTEYTETSTYKIERSMDIDFTKIPVDASILMDDETMDLLEPYDYAALEKFQTKYMSGFFGEMKNMEPESVESRARIKAKRDAKELMNQTISGYSAIVPQREDVNLNNTKTEYALLPVWAYTYRYKGKDYHFKLNGQTGKMIGKIPISIEKALGYSSTLFIGLSAAVMLLAYLIF